MEVTKVIFYSPYVHIWVKECKPKTCKEAGEYADDYFQARGPRLDSSNGKQSVAHLEGYVDCVMDVVTWT